MPDNRIDFPPYDSKCPSCGHEFSLADLKRMAVGGGWQRMLLIENKADPRGFSHVSFDEFDPVNMREFKG
jgi:hypothetical protein